MAQRHMMLFQAADRGIPQQSASGPWPRRVWELMASSSSLGELATPPSNDPKSLAVRAHNPPHARTQKSQESTPNVVRVS